MKAVSGIGVQGVLPLVHGNLPSGAIYWKTLLLPVCIRFLFLYVSLVFPRRELIADNVISNHFAKARVASKLVARQNYSWDARTLLQGVHQHPNVVVCNTLGCKLVSILKCDITF